MLIAAVSILAVSLLVPPIDSLVLVTGERIEVANAPEIAGSTVVFRAANDGALYSIPLDEIDLNATNRANRQRPAKGEERRPAETSAASALDDLKRADAARSISSRSIVVSEDERTRLIQQLSKSREIRLRPARFGTAPPAPQPPAEKLRARPRTARSGRGGIAPAATRSACDSARKSCSF